MHNTAEELRYEEFLWKQHQEWEATCTRCGACCGVFADDPCEYLAKSEDGRYRCGIYERRLGTHTTRSGKALRCVPIREILQKNWPGSQRCGYKR